jgi:hypothetical protein
MTATNTLGIRNGNQIVAYGQTTRQTKWLDLVLTTDITCPQTGFAVTKCRARFTSDSVGKWAMEINLDASFTSATVSSVVITFPNLAFSSVITGVINGGWTGTTVVVRALISGSTITVDSASTNSVSGARLSGTIQLDSNPTTYTIAANMEGAVNASVYIAEATSTSAGLLSSYEEYDGTTAACTGAITSNGS